MAKWDVYTLADHKQLFGVSDEVIKEMILSGRLGPDDFLRLAGTTEWTPARLVKGVDKLLAKAGRLPPEAAPSPPPPGMAATEPVMAVPPPPPPSRGTAPPPPPPPSGGRPRIDRAPIGPDDSFATIPDQSLLRGPVPPRGAVPPPPPPLPVAAPPPPLPTDGAVGDGSQGESFAEEFEEVGLTNRKRRPAVEGLDLTAMVDVTFLLVLFFMVSTTYTLQHSIQVPAPNPDKSATQAASLEQLDDQHIIVTIDNEGTVLIDGFQSAGDYNSLVTNLKKNVRDTERNEVIIDADVKARHEVVVRVIDAAEEVGMQHIKLASRAETGE